MMEGFEMFQITAAEMITKVQVEIAAKVAADRDAFYADDEIWAHEFCGAECDGSEH